MLSVREAAAILGVSPKTVRWRLEKGKLAGRKVGRDWIVPRAEVKKQPKGKQTPGPAKGTKPEPPRADE